MGNWWDDRPSKRTLGIREREILWRRAGKKCEGCGKKIYSSEIEVGHKRAHSKGGRATLENCVCLCQNCNKLQWTDGWTTFLKKMENQPESSKTKEILKGLSMEKLKLLAQKHNIKVKSRAEGFLESCRKPPSKAQYVNALAKVVSEKEIESKKRRKKRNTSDWDLF